MEIRAKIKSYDAKINTNFQNNEINEITKESLKFICLSVTLIDFIFKICKIYYPQVFVEECKYLVKEKNMPECFTDEIEISSDSDIEENTDEESFYVEN